jgi:hypothetical protein
LDKGGGFRSPNSKGQDTASFYNKKSNLCSDICLPAIARSKNAITRSHLKEGEEPVFDDQATGLGNGEVLPAASSGNEGDVADALLQIATEV